MSYVYEGERESVCVGEKMKRERERERERHPSRSRCKSVLAIMDPVRVCLFSSNKPSEYRLSEFAGPEFQYRSLFYVTRLT